MTDREMIERIARKMNNVRSMDIDDNQHEISWETPSGWVWWIFDENGNIIEMDTNPTN